MVNGSEKMSFCIASYIKTTTTLFFSYRFLNSSVIHFLINTKANHSMCRFFSKSWDDIIDAMSSILRATVFTDQLIVLNKLTFSRYIHCATEITLIFLHNCMALELHKAHAIWHKFGLLLSFNFSITTPITSSLN